jgi:hypothetical protein
MRVAAIGIVLLWSCGVATASAQQRQFGVKLGATVASVDDDAAGEASGYSRRISLAGGGFVVLPLSGRFAAQIEALFAPKGGKLPSGEEEVTVKLLLDYFELPVLLRMTATRSATRSFHVFGGPSLGLRTNAKRDVSTFEGTFRVGYADDIGEEVNRLELGIIAGGGVDVARHFVIDARYFWGLTDVNRDSTGGSIRNRALTILAGYRF